MIKYWKKITVSYMSEWSISYSVYDIIIKTVVVVLVYEIMDNLGLGGKTIRTFPSIRMAPNEFFLPWYIMLIQSLFYSLK